jgi:hypothetical protein
MPGTDLEAGIEAFFARADVACLKCTTPGTVAMRAASIAADASSRRVG